MIARYKVKEVGHGNHCMLVHIVFGHMIDISSMRPELNCRNGSTFSFDWTELEGFNPVNII